MAGKDMPAIPTASARGGVGRRKVRENRHVANAVEFLKNPTQAQNNSSSTKEAVFHTHSIVFRKGVALFAHITARVVMSQVCKTNQKACVRMCGVCGCVPVLSQGAGAIVKDKCQGGPAHTHTHTHSPTVLVPAQGGAAPELPSELGGCEHAESTAGACDSCQGGGGGHVGGGSAGEGEGSGRRQASLAHNSSCFQEEETHTTGGKGDENEIAAEGGEESISEEG